MRPAGHVETYQLHHLPQHEPSLRPARDFARILMRRRETLKAVRADTKFQSVGKPRFSIHHGWAWIFADSCGCSRRASVFFRVIRGSLTQVPVRKTRCCSRARQWQNSAAVRLAVNNPTGCHLKILCDPLRLGAFASDYVLPTTESGNKA